MDDYRDADQAEANKLRVFLRRARGSVDKHRRIMARTVNQAFRKGDAKAADRYGKQLDTLTKLLADIDAALAPAPPDEPCDCATWVPPAACDQCQPMRPR